MWPSVIKGVASTKKLWVQVSVRTSYRKYKKYPEASWPKIRGYTF